MKVPNPYLQNIRDLILNAEKYRAGQTVASLEKDQLTFAALDMTVTRICRHLFRLNELFAQEYPQLLLHNFPNLSTLQQTPLIDHQPATLLQACQLDIPQLKPLVFSILQDLETQKNAGSQEQQ